MLNSSEKSTQPAVKPRRRGFIPGSQLKSFPLKEHLRGYSTKAFRADAGAALNVALLAVPQALAFATIAGLPVEATAILCGAVAAIIGGLLAGSRFTIMGPTNATALMAFSALSGIGAGPEFLPILVFMSGLLLIAAAGLRMADMIQYISRSVIVGYITGAAVLIAAGQLREALGIPPLETRPSSFFDMLHTALSRLELTNPAALGTGLAAAAVYTILKKYAPRYPAFAIALAASAVGAAVLRQAGHVMPMLQPFTPGSLIPEFGTLFPREALTQLGRLIGPALAIAFLSALENTVMSKGLSGKTGETPDINQDLLASGVANLASAVTGGMPASGSLTRSALNHSSGAQTPVSAIIMGLLGIAAVLLLGNVMAFLPRAGLSALFICVAAGLIRRRQLLICWRATRSDAITLAITIAASLLMPLHVAIFIGVATSVVLYLRKAARPVLVEYEFNPTGELQEKRNTTDRQNPAISIVHVEGELFFGAAELLRTQIQRTAADENLRVIILRMKNARHLDATSVMALEDLVLFLRGHDRHLIISGLSREVYRVLFRSGMIDVVGRDNIFMGSAQNPNLSTRKALKRAQVLLGTTSADIRIFYDPARPQEG